MDVYCGAGLFSEGLRREGLRPVFAVDVDPIAVKSYRRNVARVAEVGDARSVPAGVKADVLIAGPPCQGFSTLGRQDPKDERNLLSLAIPRWAAACESQVVVVENVPSFIGSSVANRLVHALESQGYAVRSQILEAAHFGVAQYRRRGFLIASKAGPVGTPASAVRVPRTVGRDSWTGLSGQAIRCTFGQRRALSLLNASSRFPAGATSATCSLSERTCVRLRGFAWGVKLPTCGGGWTRTGPRTHFDAPFRTRRKDGTFIRLSTECCRCARAQDSKGSRTAGFFAESPIPWPGRLATAFQCLWPELLLA